MPYQYGTGLPAGIALAPVGSRIGAAAIDGTLFVIGYVIVQVFVSIVLTGTSGTSNGSSAIGGLALGGFWLILLGFVPAMIFVSVALKATKGATIGKLLLKQRVVRLADGGPIGWGGAFLNSVPSLAMVVPCFCYLLAPAVWIWSGINLSSNPLRQTPYDLIAKTVVVSVP